MNNREEFGETLQERRATDRHKKDKKSQFPGHNKQHKGSWCIQIQYMWLVSKQGAKKEAYGMLGKRLPKCYGPEVFIGLEDEMSYEDAQRLLGALKWEEGLKIRPYLK